MPENSRKTRRMNRVENRALNQLEYRERRESLRSRPRFVLVELTRECNLSCPMCRNVGEAAEPRTMPQGLFNAVADELFGTADIIDLHGWGESVVHPRFLPSLDRVERAGATLRIVTNLSYRSPEAVARLAETRSFVSVSIDSANAATLSQIRRGASLLQIAENLRILRPNIDRVNFYVTLQRPALPDIERIVDFAADHGVPEVRLHPVSIHPDSPLSLEGVIKETDGAVARLRSRAKVRGIRLVIGKFPIGSHRNVPFTLPCCLHPWSFFCVQADGGVTFCDGLVNPRHDRGKMGTWGEHSFWEIWNNGLWQRLRRHHAGKKDALSPHYKTCERCRTLRPNDFDHLLNPEAEKLNVVLQDHRK